MIKEIIHVLEALDNITYDDYLRASKGFIAPPSVETTVKVASLYNDCTLCGERIIGRNMGCNYGICKEHRYHYECYKREQKQYFLFDEFRRYTDTRDGSIKHKFSFYLHDKIKTMMENDKKS